MTVGLNSMLNFLSGYNGDNLSKNGRSKDSVASISFTVSIFNNAKYFSLSRGFLIVPFMVSPVLKLKRLICEGET